MVIEFFTKESPLSYDQERAFKVLFAYRPELVDIKGNTYYYRGYLWSKGGAQKERDKKLINEDISKLGSEIYSLEFHL